jgi:hypothetical protein
MHNRDSKSLLAAIVDQKQHIRKLKFCVLPVGFYPDPNGDQKTEK